MTEEATIKKEDKLTYKGGFLKTKRGSLVLTPTELFFLSGNEKVFSILTKDIINVRAQKGIGNGIDHLYIVYKDEQKDKEAKIEHFSFWDGAAIGNLSRLKDPYFKLWEKTIEDVRLGKKEVVDNFSDLEKLAELKQKGIISEEEFSAKKKQILGI